MTDLHIRWPHRWITPKALSKESRMHGFGVFAKQTISKGENIAVFGGVVVPASQIQAYWQEIDHIGIQISDDFFIVPTTRKEVETGGVFNHSCEPNCGFSNSLTLIAIKNIQVGEELVFDYAFCETIMGDMHCNCKAPTCRKRVTGKDWQKKDIQEKYLQYFSPYLQKKI